MGGCVDACMYVRVRMYISISGVQKLGHYTVRNSPLAVNPYTKILLSRAPDRLGREGMRFLNPMNYRNTHATIRRYLQSAPIVESYDRHWG